MGGEDPKPEFTVLNKEKNTAHFSGLIPPPGFFFLLIKWFLMHWIVNCYEVSSKRHQSLHNSLSYALPFF